MFECDNSSTQKLTMQSGLTSRRVLRGTPSKGGGRVEPADATPARYAKHAGDQSHPVKSLNLITYALTVDYVA